MTAKKTKHKLMVTVLGSGTCVPSLTRSACAVLMEIGGHKLLFDLGPGTMRRLLEADTTLNDIGFIFLSHFHPDHTGELVPFLFATKYAQGEKRRVPLTIVGGRGLKNFYMGLKAVYGSWVELEPGLLKFIELDINDKGKQVFEGFTVDAKAMQHNAESLAFRITSAGKKSAVYSGDTDFNANLITLSQDTDLLICECAFPDDAKIDGHLTPSLAGEIGSRAKVRRLMLTHFYPQCDQVDVAAQCRQTYDGELILAEDLMQIVLS
jgi:ribonuclease BN (tRNA processing enzyme)